MQNELLRIALRVLACYRERCHPNTADVEQLRGAVEPTEADQDADVLANLVVQRELKLPSSRRERITKDDSTLTIALRVLQNVIDGLPLDPADISILRGSIGDYSEAWDVDKLARRVVENETRMGELTDAAG